jgi:hypothetical protein
MYNDRAAVTPNRTPRRKRPTARPRLKAVRAEALPRLAQKQAGRRGDPLGVSAAGFSAPQPAPDPLDQIVNHFSSGAACSDDRAIPVR